MEHCGKGLGYRRRLHGCADLSAWLPPLLPGLVPGDPTGYDLWWPLVKERHLGQDLSPLGLERLINLVRTGQGYLCLLGAATGIMSRQGRWY